MIRPLRLVSFALVLATVLAGRAGAQPAPTTATPPAPAPAPPPASVSAAPAAPTTVGTVELKETKDLNTGDTAWMLTSSALVLMMTGPGLALFYSGLVRRKNVLATM